MAQNSKSPVSTQDPSQRFLLALSLAGQNVLRATTSEEVYQTIGDEVVALGHQAVIFRLPQDNTCLTIPFLTFDSNVLKAVEKLAGVSSKDHRIPLKEGSAYHQVVFENRPIYLESIIEPLAETLPMGGEAVAIQILKILGLKQAIYAPLAIEEKCEGILLIMGDNLCPEDVTAITVFANQIASALENVRLITEVRKSELKFRQVSENIEDGVAVTVDNRNYWVNPAFAKMFGYKPAEMLGKGPELVVAPAGLELFEEHAQKRAGGDQIPAHVEIPAIHKSGKPMQIHVTLRQIEFDDQPALQIVVRDITERAQYQEQLQIFSRFIEASNQGFGMASLDGKIRYANAALLDLIAEVDLESVAGNPIIDYYPKEYQQKMSQEVIPAIMENGKWSGETVLKSRAGKRIDVLENYFLIRNEDGQPQFIADVLTDISNSVKSERELRQALEKIEQNQNLLSSLSQASQNVQRAQTPEEVYQTVGIELKNLDLDTLFFILTEDKQSLEIVHSTHSPKVLQAAEQLVGLKAVGHSFPISGTMYEQFIENKQTVYSDEPIAPMKDAFPKAVRPLVVQIAGMLNVENAIFAPITVHEDVIGLLVVTGKDLCPDEVPSMSTFANQASIALENTQLYLELETKAKQLEHIVTERTNELTDSEEKYRILVERAIDGIVIAQDGVMKYANQRFAEMHGYEIGEIIGKNFLDIVPEESRQSVLERYEKRMAGEEIQAMYEMTALRKDGSHFPIEVNAGLVPYEGGKADLVFLRDISERKEIEEHIRFQAEILRGVSDAIISADENYVILSWNNSAEKIYGWRADQVIGKYFQDIVQPDYGDISRDQIVADFEKFGRYEGEVLHHRKDGTPFYVHSVVNEIKDHHGKNTVIVAVNRDISQRRAAEAELTIQMEDLERFNRLAVGREQRVIALKQRVNNLLGELGQEPEYRLSYLDE